MLKIDATPISFICATDGDLEIAAASSNLFLREISFVETFNSILRWSAPDYFHWGGGRRYRTEDPVARLRYAGRNGVGEAQFAHGFLGRLHFFCGDTPLFAPANADAQNAREIATLAHQIDQPHNPPGRVVVVISRMCAFAPDETSKKPRTLDLFHRPKVAYARPGTWLHSRPADVAQQHGRCLPASRFQ